MSFSFSSFIKRHAILHQSAAMTAFVCTVTSSAFAAAPHVATGKIVELVPEKREIYMLPEAPPTGESEVRKLEYYFTPETKVLSAAQEAQYRDLQLGMRVTVTAKKIGKRLDPVQVEILPAQ